MIIIFSFSICLGSQISEYNIFTYLAFQILSEWTTWAGGQQFQINDDRFYVEEWRTYMYLL